MKGWQIASVAGAFVLLLVVGSVWFFVLRSDGGIGVAAAPAKAKGMLRLATFNVEGLFDAEDDLKLTGANDDVASSEAHLAGIAEAIRVADADIVALQDVESIAALEWTTASGASDAPSTARMPLAMLTRSSMGTAWRR